MHPFRFSWLTWPRFLFIVLGCSLGAAYGQSMDGADGRVRGAAVAMHDSLLVGKWKIIESFNRTGARTGESFEIEYCPDGKTAFNRKALYEKFNQRVVSSGSPPQTTRDLDRHFPRVTWKTQQDRIILTFKSRFGINELTYRYQIRGDTLTTVNELFTGTRSKLVAIRGDR